MARARIGYHAGVKTLLAIGGAAICTAGLWVADVSARRDVNVGDPAPLFSLPGTDGKTYRLAAYKGKQAVVLAWFAKAFTGG
jgi:peroxiredoxin Q/BCP